MQKDDKKNKKTIDSLNLFIKDKKCLKKFLVGCKKNSYVKIALLLELSHNPRKPHIH